MFREHHDCGYGHDWHAWFGWPPAIRNRWNAKRHAPGRTPGQARNHSRRQRVVYAGRQG